MATPSPSAEAVLPLESCGCSALQLRQPLLSARTACRCPLGLLSGTCLTGECRCEWRRPHVKLVPAVLTGATVAMGSGKCTAGVDAQIGLSPPLTASSDASADAFETDLAPCSRRHRGLLALRLLTGEPLNDAGEASTPFPACFRSSDEPCCGLLQLWMVPGQLLLDRCGAVANVTVLLGVPFGLPGCEPESDVSCLWACINSFSCFFHPMTDSSAACSHQARQ